MNKTDYEVYGYYKEQQSMEICYTLPEARKAAKSMWNDGLYDIRIVKHDETDEAVAFWDISNQQEFAITRSE